MKLTPTNISLVVIIAVSFFIHQLLKKFLTGSEWGFATSNSAVVFIAMILFALFYGAILLAGYFKKDK
ncbi:MAG TPA: hypothetical protein PKY31_07010 [Spirochaetota bacterium]|nr:hypothetical protein [Spirochaetota bacterium]